MLNQEVVTKLVYCTESLTLDSLVDRVIQLDWILQIIPSLLLVNPVLETVSDHKRMHLEQVRVKEAEKGRHSRRLFCGQGSYVMPESPN